MLEVEITPRSPAELHAVLRPVQIERLEAAAARARELLAGRVVWSVSSTATGGGVAEMLHTLLGYVTGAGVQARWAVLAGDAPFFAFTKRLHNAIHGFGDPPLPGTVDAEHYDRVQRENLPGLLRLLGPEDIVVLHDPQPAGLVEPLQRAGHRVIWRSHIGRDRPNDQSVGGWEFLRGHVQTADGFVFSRRQYAPPWVPADRLWVIPPSIDPLSPKNWGMSPAERLGVLTAAGVLAAGEGPRAAITRRVLMQGGPPPPADAPLVVQVSRWDRLKDMAGVMTGFAGVATELPDAHLLLVGPDVVGVTDDPEGAAVQAECAEAWQALPAAVRERVHLVSVPMEDPVENALIVNAVQRHAAVVAQKSLVEGFGLTVAEAMWKARPVVGGAVGGIGDQIADGRDGLLVDPTDSDAFGRAVWRLLADPALAHRLGQAARERVRDQYLGDRHLAQYAELVEAVATAAG